MTLTNVYASLDAFKAHIGVDAADVSQNVRLEAALNAASRLIDDHCDRRFYADASPVERQYYADSTRDVEVDDVSTLTGLVVKIDDDDDGVFETTLTIGTHFIALPTNAADQGEPFTDLRMVDPTYRFPRWRSGRPGVQVTATFGWASVPPSVSLACVIQAAQLLKAGDAPFGVLQLTTFDGAPVRIGSSLHPSAQQLLVGYQRPRVG